MKSVTILVIGDTGVGKSQFGNAFLQNDEAFMVSDLPCSETYKTCSQSNVINNTTINYIDTPGLNSSDGYDSYYIQEMIEFLKKWELGINAIGLLINIQNPRFSLDTQKLIQLYNNFFNNPMIWNQVVLIFTRSFPGYYDKNIAKGLYRNKVQEFIKKLPGCGDINPEIPCFFVDSANWKNDLNTKSEIIHLLEFAKNNPSISTQQLKLVVPSYKKKEEEILKKILVKTEYSKSNNEKVCYYEDKKRYKLTDWEGKVHYTDPEIIKSWVETKFTTIQVETKIECYIKSKPIFRYERYGSHRYFCIGIPQIEKKIDHYIEIKTFIEYKRNVFIDPDGEKSYSEWEKSREWIEENTDK